MKRILAILLVCYCLAVLGCKNESAWNVGEKGVDVWDAGVVFNNPRGQTPAGSKVYAKFSLTDQNLRDTDAGIKFTQDIIRAEYKDSLALKFLKGPEMYHIDYYKKNSLCIEQGFIITAYAMAGNGWLDQSEWDKDKRPGYIAVCAAGKYGLKEMTYHYLSLVVGNVKIAAQYEAEHACLFDVDQPRFSATSSDHYHPILTQPSGVESVSKAFAVDIPIVPVVEGKEPPTGKALEAADDQYCVWLVK